MKSTLNPVFKVLDHFGFWGPVNLDALVISHDSPWDPIQSHWISWSPDEVPWNPKNFPRKIPKDSSPIVTCRYFFSCRSRSSCPQEAMSGVYNCMNLRRGCVFEENQREGTPLVQAGKDGRWWKMMGDDGRWWNCLFGWVMMSYEGVSNEDDIEIGWQTSSCRVD